MNNHKILYKEQPSFTIDKRRFNRELMAEKRIEKRKNRYQDSRNISPSPIRHKKELTISINCPENKENNITTEENKDVTRLAKIVCSTTNPEKLTKQEAYVKRFLEWKEKHSKKEEIKNKMKPFCSAVSNMKASTYNFVPSGHHKGFRPPDGLKKIEDIKNEKTKPAVVKGRQSIYSIIPTPPRSEIKYANKVPLAKKSVSKSLHTNILSSKETIKDSKNLAISSSKPATINKSVSKTQATEEKKPTSKQSATKSLPKNGAINLVRTLEINKPTKTENFVEPPPRKHLKKFCTVKISPKQHTNRQTGAIAKTRSVAKNLAGTSKQNKNSPLKKSGAGLAKNLKAKKVNTIKKGNIPTLQINGKNLKNLINNNKPTEDMAIQTPRDFFTLNPFEEFVTSTRIKHSTENSKNVEGNFPKEKSHGRLHRTSLFKECDSKSQETSKEGDLKRLSKKFNFIKYCNEADVVADVHQKAEGNEKQDSENENNMLSNGDNKIAQVPEGNKTSPVESASQERPIINLSPHVIVEHGKVSLNKEEQKKKQNIVNLQNAPESTDIPPLSPEYSVEIRRIIEGAQCFRKQLQDEIDRLHKLCNIWEAYKIKNLELILDANGEDLINVTIGQTRLLTAKKFMQFKGLIDRCEAGATGIGKVAYDGSENTKPITLVDLEGFWSMLGLQIENLDKRFENLNRWKLNDWKDPDEEDTKIKKKLTKVKKKKSTAVSKAKPNTALQHMLRKMHAEMRKNKNSINEDDQQTQTMEPTPRKSLNTTTTHPLYTVVKDRKYFSPARTVLSVSSSNSRLSRKQRKSLQDSPKVVKHSQEFSKLLDGMPLILTNEKPRVMSLNSLAPKTDSRSNDAISLDSAAINNKENKVPTALYMCSTTQSPSQSQLHSERKSILKTPGTAKSKQSNVIFNNKVRARKFNFINNEDGTLLNDENREDANETLEEDLAKSCEEKSDNIETHQRTLTLRSRKIRLRPSYEIVIPK